MSRIEIPIAGQVLWSTGDIRLGADIELLLNVSFGNFVGDTGSEIATFHVYAVHR